MRTTLPFLAICFAATTLAENAANHRFDPQGAYLPDGFPEHTPKILAVAEKPMTMHFMGVPADWQPVVLIHRINSARLIELQPAKAEFTDNGWLLTWAPPATRGPAQYQIELDGKPKRVVRIETREPTWLKATLEMLANQAEWNAQGLTAEERTALTNHGLKISKSSSSEKKDIASLEMRPRQGAAARRRVVWDEQEPGLIVWRPGPAAGDLEVRAPRWWISPAALATDQGLIRFLDLFSEPPLNP